MQLTKTLLSIASLAVFVGLVSESALYADCTFKPVVPHTAWSQGKLVLNHIFSPDKASNAEVFWAYDADVKEIVDKFAQQGKGRQEVSLLMMKRGLSSGVVISKADWSKFVENAQYPANDDWKVYVVSPKKSLHKYRPSFPMISWKRAPNWATATTDYKIPVEQLKAALKPLTCK